VSDGTALPRFKRAFIAKLASLGVPNVSYQSPMQPEEMWGDDGSGLCCWFGDEATATTTITVVGAGALWIDETWNIPFRIQALGGDTDSDQQTVDQAACERLGDVMGAFSDPHFGITDDTVQTFAAVPVGTSPWYGGVLPTNTRAAAYELSIELRARIEIAA
jgi:hypothetical protein